MTPPYAQGTNVPLERSKAELERILIKYGATRSISGWDQGQIVIGFEMQRRQVKMSMPIPSKDDPAICMTPSGKYRRSDAQVMGEWQAAIRQRWRALVLIIKAKLEAVDAGVVTFEEEFLGQLVLPQAGGRTVSELIVPHLDNLPRALTAGRGNEQ